ncbi:MAG: hypothetical protein Q8P15_02380 [Nanoarchaeota archaeon]|nr:hypothetical protein [Nanoarchaeota archaeon]
MVIGATFLVIAAAVIIIWVFLELSHFKHKILTVLLIGFILFLYLSTTMVFRGKDVDIQSVSGISEATGIYFSWLGSFFGNLKTVTSNVIHMDWGSSDVPVNETNK